MTFFKHPSTPTCPTKELERKRNNFKAGLEWCEVGYPISYLNDPHRRMLMSELEAKGLVEVVYVLTDRGEDYNAMATIPDEILQTPSTRDD